MPSRMGELLTTLYWRRIVLTIPFFSEQVFIPPGEVPLDRLDQEDVFTFNIEFDKDGNPELSSEVASPCHNISAYTNLYLRVFQVSFVSKTSFTSNNVKLRWDDFHLTFT